MRQGVRQLATWTQELDDAQGFRRFLRFGASRLGPLPAAAPGCMAVSDPRAMVVSMIVAYEDSDDPAIAIAPLGSDVPTCRAWVRSNKEFLMAPSPSGPWTLFYLSDGGTVVAEDQPFWHAHGARDAARQMRIWINNQAGRGHL